MGRTLNRRHWMLTTALGGALAALASGGGAAAQDGASTTTPIKHVIILIGENRTFDNIYGMYQPGHGQSVWNLLSRGIVTATGGTKLNTKAQQYQINTLTSATYFIDASTQKKTLYKVLPQPNTAYAPQNTHHAG